MGRIFVETLLDEFLAVGANMFPIFRFKGNMVFNYCFSRFLVSLVNERRNFINNVIG